MTGWNDLFSATASFGSGGIKRVEKWLSNELAYCLNFYNLLAPALKNGLSFLPTPWKGS